MVYIFFKYSNNFSLKILFFIEILYNSLYSLKKLDI